MVYGSKREQVLRGCFCIPHCSAKLLELVCSLLVLHFYHLDIFLIDVERFSHVYVSHKAVFGSRVFKREKTNIKGNVNGEMYR